MDAANQSRLWSIKSRKRAMNNEKNNLFQDAIKTYLDKRAAEDEQFAAVYAKEGKSIEKCCNYICGEVQKSGRNGFSDDEIYGLAVHYYDEDDITVKDLLCKVVVNRSIDLTDEQKEKLRAEAEDEYKRQVISDIKRKEEAAKKKAQEKAKAISEQMQNAPSLFD